jgi:hypothetical protein
MCNFRPPLTASIVYAVTAARRMNAASERVRILRNEQGRIGGSDVAHSS